MIGSVSKHKSYLITQPINASYIYAKTHGHCFTRPIIMGPLFNVNKLSARFTQ